MTQLKYLLRQSYDVFQIYGKEPEALRNVLSGFSVVLKDFDIRHITDAFKEWMGSSHVFPTPADICKLAAENREIEKSRINSSARQTGVVFTQVIRDYETDAILVEYRQGNHQADVDLRKIFPGKRYRMSFRREV